MMKSVCAMAAILAVITLSISGCGGGQDNTNINAVGDNDDYSAAVQAGKYLVLGTLTDNVSNARAKANAEDTLIKHPDIDCMVGLWAYNPPMILSALKHKGLEGKVAVIGFDEHGDTLQGIADGHIHGTIAQQPYVFGYRSIEYLAAMLRGKDQKEVVSKDQIFIPFTMVRKEDPSAEVRKANDFPGVLQENVVNFSAHVNKILAGNGDPPPYCENEIVPQEEYDTSKRVKIAFLTNSVNPFWDFADEGCKLAAKRFNVECKFVQPSDGTVADQKRYMEDFVTEGFDGLAVTSLDPDNQVEMINAACAKMKVICHDADAPNSERLFYIGTSNYKAGRAAGRLIKEAIPAGGKVMIFVGKMEVLNAQERRQGLIDELAGKEYPPGIAEE